MTVATIEFLFICTNSSKNNAMIVFVTSFSETRNSAALQTIASKGFEQKYFSTNV